MLNKILAGFHDYENYKLQVRKSGDSKVTSTLGYELDPHWRTKFENVKKMYYYLQKELPNMDEYIHEACKKKRDRLTGSKPLHEVYETIRLNNISIRMFDNQLNKIIDQLKYAKQGRAIFKDISLNLMSSASARLNTTNSKLVTSTTNDDCYNDENSYKNTSLNEKSRLEDSELISQIAQIRLKDDSNLNKLN